MKKTLAAIITASILACSSPAPEPTVTPPLPTPTPVIIERIIVTEMKKVVAVKIFQLGGYSYIDLGYDTDNNGIPDLYEVHTTIYHPEVNWIEIVPEPLRTYRDSNEDGKADTEEFKDTNVFY